MTNEIDKYFEVAKKLILQAGEKLKDALNKEKIVKVKNPCKSLVTQYDTEIESMLIARLAEEFPDHKFIAEESYNTNEELQLTDSPTWMIDPIDGTTNFIHGFPHCCISVGLAINKQVELGIIFDPHNNQLFTAKRGAGTFVNGNQLKVSNTTKLKNSLIILEPLTFNWIPKMRDIGLGRIDALGNAADGVRSIGSAAIAMTLVAKGVADAFQMDHLKPWDVAAGLLLIEEAGGVVIDTKGGPLNIMKPQVIAAASDSLAREISKLIIDTDLQTQRKRLKKT
ncbi:inositol monophosphatase 2-like [Chelonus insularis]|uniref:inositol monophosphatase 2-like n=1 Tax=Chelonus insularis TaxID=460826 RepID=UPI0015887672|nr:inositol monophosphatase 2-like [Chelonus insularis]